MSMSYTPRATTANDWSSEKTRAFPKGFWTGIAMAMTIWAALAFGTTLSVGSSPLNEPAQLAQTH